MFLSTTAFYLIPESIYKYTINFRNQVVVFVLFYFKMTDTITLQPESIQQYCLSERLFGIIRFQIR